MTYTFRCARCVLLGARPGCTSPRCGEQVPLRRPTEDGMFPGPGGQMTAIPPVDRVAIDAELRRMDQLPCGRPWTEAAEGCCAHDPPIGLYGRLWASSYSPALEPQKYHGYRIRAEVCTPVFRVVQQGELAGRTVLDLEIPRGAEIRQGDTIMTDRGRFQVVSVLLGRGFGHLTGADISVVVRKCAVGA